jgi:hypothetical protein
VNTTAFLNKHIKQKPELRALFNFKTTDPYKEFLWDNVINFVLLILIIGLFVLGVISKEKTKQDNIIFVLLTILIIYPFYLFFSLFLKTIVMKICLLLFLFLLGILIFYKIGIISEKKKDGKYIGISILILLCSFLPFPIIWFILVLFMIIMDIYYNYYLIKTGKDLETQTFKFQLDILK